MSTPGRNGNGTERRRQKCQDDARVMEIVGTGNDQEIENTRSKTGFGRTLRSKDRLKKKGGGKEMEGGR